MIFRHKPPYPLRAGFNSFVFNGGDEILYNLWSEIYDACVEGFYILTKYYTFHRL